MFKLVFGVTKQFHSTECFFKIEITKAGCAECHGKAQGLGTEGLGAAESSLS